MMTQDLAAISSDAVRFDRPFLIYLIREFFFVLLGVIVVELGLRFVSPSWFTSSAIT